MSSRLERLRAELMAAGVDAILVSQIENIRYLSGFTGSYAFLIITLRDAYLLTDARYVEQASQECQGYAIEEFQGGWTKKASELAGSLGIRRLGFEAPHLSYDAWNSLRENLGKVELIPLDDVIGKLRTIKDEAEIVSIREAAKIADMAFDHVIGLLKPGMSEKEIAIEIDFFMRKNGDDKEAFETLVASGPRSALPHGKPTDRVVSEGELLLLDFGARWQGYHSDITRTVVMGRENPKQTEIHRIVLEAQARAINAIHPGISGGDIDKIARDYITQEGYGEYFGHGLGHGIGLAVHDGVNGGRILGKASKVILKAGMVVTVEPGIYIPRWGGIRIEDDVLVTDSGAEVLTHSSHKLGICAV